MKCRIGTVAVAGLTVMLTGPRGANAQASATFQSTLAAAELSELNPDQRVEVETRLKQGGQTVPEILQTILLNNIKLKFSANRVIALDFGRGVAVVELARNCG